MHDNEKPYEEKIVIQEGETHIGALTKGHRFWLVYIATLEGLTAISIPNSNFHHDPEDSLNYFSTDIASLDDARAVSMSKFVFHEIVRMSNHEFQSYQKKNFQRSLTDAEKPIVVKAIDSYLKRNGGEGLHPKHRLWTLVADAGQSIPS